VLLFQLDMVNYLADPHYKPSLQHVVATPQVVVHITGKRFKALNYHGRRISLQSGSDDPRDELRCIPGQLVAQAIQGRVCAAVHLVQVVLEFSFASQRLVEHVVYYLRQGDGRAQTDGSVLD